jgi:hypothetical protein
MASPPLLLQQLLLVAAVAAALLVATVAAERLTFANFPDHVGPQQLAAFKALSRAARSQFRRNLAAVM